MSRRALFALLAALLGTAAVAAEAPAHDDACLGVAETQESIRTGAARRLTEIGPRPAGEILRTDLCRGDAGLFYRVLLLDDRGHVRQVHLDARSGRVLYDGR